MKTPKKCLPAWTGMAVAMVGLGALSAPLHAANAPGRLAYIADGNNKDVDDYCGTPVGLAILQAKGLGNKLVHYSHSCDLKATTNSREAIMQEACDGTHSRWGGFSHIKFYNVQDEYNSAKNHLAEQINNSSATDPLYIIEAGEPDIIYDALDVATPSKRQYVYVITHHDHNDAGADPNKDLADIIADFGVTKVKIPDQNTNLDTGSPYSKWEWARDHADERLKWLWHQGKEVAKKPNFDCSDAGMVWFWATGAVDDGPNETPEVSELRELLEGYVNGGGGGGGTANVAPTVSLTSPTNNAIFTSPASIRLTANASDSDGSIAKVEFRANGTLIATENAAPYDWTWTNVTAGTYTIIARAYDNQGATKDSGSASVTVQAGQAGGVQAPWTAGDVGSVTPAGSATHADGVYTVKGAGKDIWGTADGFHFVSQSISGDCVITAQVTSQQNTNDWAKAGVMIRESRNAGSKHASMFITPAKGASFQRRVDTDGTSAGTTVSGHKAPYWVRLQRSGNKVTGFRSADGASWTTVGSVTFTMNAAVEVGLAVTSHVNGTLGTVTFDNVSVSSSSTPSNGTISITDDCYLENGTRKNDEYLKIESGTRTRIAYVRFSVSGLGGVAPANATLTLTVNGDAGNGKLFAHKGSHSDWSETNLTSSTAPTESTKLAEVNRTFSLGNKIDINVAPIITGDGNYTVILRLDAGGNDFWLGSDEGTTAKPVISINLAPSSSG